MAQTPSNGSTEAVPQLQNSGNPEKSGHKVHRITMGPSIEHIATQIAIAIQIAKCNTDYALPRAVATVSE